MSDTVHLPQALNDTLELLLAPEDEDLEEVTISTTRSNRTIKDIATRIEMLNGEELDEKSNMKPGDIRMVLSESTGIQTQQTSATSGNSSIRIEGLDGRYTQILKDGFPLYAGFSGGLGLLQTPPLDLKQIEIIKGSSSTLYGGGAIAGLVNLISRTPTEDRDLRFMINGTSAGGIDLNGFYGQRFGKVGVTLYAGFDGNAPYDPAGIGFTAIPQVSRYTFNPRLFLYLSKRTEVIAGINGTLENRKGGDIRYIRGSGDSLHTYFEDNQSKRLSAQIEVKHRFSDNSQLSIKNSADHFVRTITMPGYKFEGRQNSTFSEVSYSTRRTKTEWVAGADIFTDGFKEKQLSSIQPRNYDQITMGAFLQNTCDVSKTFIIESGVRTDYVVNYGPAILPRISVLYKSGRHITSRLGGGLGYKSPSIFTEESERIQYRNVLGVNKDSNKLEKSFGGNWDVNYKTLLADSRVTLSVNQLFFYTRLDNPLILTPKVAGQYRFVNTDAHIDANGAETNVKIGYQKLKLYLGYTYTHAHIHYGNIESETPLTPRHRTNTVLTYEAEGKWKIGLEAYYYSQQRLSDGSTGRSYWLCGFMAEKIWKKCSVFINFENFLDSRQSRFGTVYTGSVSNPTFKDIYAPLDGFVMNGGLKIRL
jgi:iron complex outermembrane receptor protein